MGYLSGYLAFMAGIFMFLYWLLQPVTTWLDAQPWIGSGAELLGVLFVFGLLMLWLWEHRPRRGRA